MKIPKGLVGAALVFALATWASGESANWSKGVYGHSVNLGGRALVLYIVGETD